ncbi:MAG: PQ-loop repeat-containing protein [Chlamydiales bacterium]|nr:PQ-loop repeat-containing protein [Chlamydiia bacterium]MCP5504509.1 PQ-loop repeat-containing protein [Chlamydiales bacterium]
MILFTISCIASITSIFSLIPQIIKIYRTRSSNDLSLSMIINFLICSLSWVIYGFLTQTMTILVTNLIMTVLTIILMIFKIRYSAKENLSYD